MTVFVSGVLVGSGKSVDVIVGVKVDLIVGVNSVVAIWVEVDVHDTNIVVKMIAEIACLIFCFISIFSWGGLPTPYLRSVQVSALLFSFK